MINSHPHCLLSPPHLHRFIEQAAWKRAEHEYTQAEALSDHRDVLDNLALEISSAADAAAFRHECIAAGDAAVASAWEKIRIGDVEGARTARQTAADAYADGGEGKSGVLQEVNNAIRDAAEQKEIKMRIANAQKRREEEEALEEQKLRQEEFERKQKEEIRRREEEEERELKECEETRRLEEEKRRQGEEQEKLRREEEAQVRNKAVLASLKMADDKVCEAREKISEKDFDAAKLARQAATDAYVKAGADRYSELKALDAEIDEAIRKQEQAEFYIRARAKAFEQATLAQARWKEDEQASKKSVIVTLQAALRRRLVQGKRGIAGKVEVPRLAFGLPPPSPNRPPSAGQDDAERARRARERRLQFLAGIGSAVPCSYLSCLPGLLVS